MQFQERKPIYYSEYLQLDKILNAQFPESEKEGIQADDEMLFIIIHQTYELWFKQVLHELEVIRGVFKKNNVPDNSPDIYNCVHRLRRINGILDILVQQIKVIETMTALDFLDFRDLLRPASGFQSIQFKMVEATLGLTYEQRFGKEYYLSQLSAEDIERVKKVEANESLLVLINRWLERMPFCNTSQYWDISVQTLTKEQPFWKQFRDSYIASLQPAEQQNITIFDSIFIDEENYPPERRLSLKASRNALFIMLYRDYPMLHLPFELLNQLLEVDEMMSMWRHRHIHMVQRTIGKRVGTGGSSGANYLKAAADSHYVFKELAELTSFLLPRHALPKLPTQLKKVLGYSEG